MTDTTFDEYTRDEWERSVITECSCTTCECYVEVEDGSVCLGCQHGVHPGEQE